MPLGELITIHPLVFNIIVVAASLALLVKTSDMVLFGITDYAKKLGLSDYLIGLVIISLGASMPELVSSVMGAFAGDSGVILGTILGSNITGITLVLGASALIAKKL
jgi:cation:H+ antiporter